MKIIMQALFLLVILVVVTYAQFCDYCDVDGNRYRGNSVFKLDRDCNRFTCRCRCDGTFICPPALTKPLCQTIAKEGTPSTHYQDCMVLGERFRQGPFSVERSCTRYNCFCYQDGSWSCPAERITSICPEPEDEERECTPCIANGKRFGPGPFQFEHPCLRYYCQCDCNGSYHCPAENTVFLCGNGN